MAKSSLDYFPLACSFEDKIELIEAEFGLRGLAIIVKLYQKIYGEFGYYCEWNDEVALLFSRKACGLPEGDNVVSEVIKAAIKREIFSENMFHEYGILTSAGIQKRYFEAVKRRTEIEVEKAYLLLSASQIPNNVNINQKNVCRNKENVYKNQQSKVEESKVNKRKGNVLSDTKVSDCSPASRGNVYQDIIDLWNALKPYGITPIRGIESQRRKLVKARLEQYGYDGFVEAVEKIKQSDFLQGKHGGRPWDIKFDWLILPNNFPKVLEGNYDNRGNAEEHSNNNFNLEDWGND